MRSCSDGVVVVELHDLGERRLDLLDHLLEKARGAGRCVLGAARHDTVHHQAVVEGAVGRGQHPLAEHAAMRVDQRERRVVADRADVAQMIGHALELGHDAAQDLGARRRIDLERLLDRARIGKAVGHGGVAGDAGDDAAGRVDIGVGQKPVDAAVDIAEPLFQPRHGLAVDGETEMAGLDDAGMHRTDRNLVQSLARHGQEFVGAGIAPRRGRPRAERRPHAPGAVIEPGPAIRNAERGEVVKIAHRALQPDRRRMEAADRRKVRGPGRAPTRRKGCGSPATRKAMCTLSFSPHRLSRSPPPSPSACPTAAQASWSIS